MATRRSTYVFKTEEDYNDAKNHIYRNMSSDYYDSDKIYFYGSWGEEYRIDIYSECSDPSAAASIFREHRGKYYDM